MAEISLTPKSPLNGQTTRIEGCSLREIDTLALTSLAVPLDGDTAFDKALKKHFGIKRPDARMSTVKGDVRGISLTPDQLLVLHPMDDGQADWGSAAYPTDQTGNWVVLELSGPRSRDVLERLCPLDVHPDAFAVGAFARTTMEHMSAVLIRTDEDAFLLLSASSSARTFWHAFEETLSYI